MYMWSLRLKREEGKDDNDDEEVDIIDEEEYWVNGEAVDREEEQLMNELSSVLLFPKPFFDLLSDLATRDREI